MVRYCISRSRLYVVLQLVSIGLQRTIAVGCPDRTGNGPAFTIPTLLVGSFRVFLDANGQRGLDAPPSLLPAAPNPLSASEQ